MSIAAAIPTLWHGAILKAYNTALVYGNLMTREYEGDIKGQGDSVRITLIGDPTISDYTRNTDLSSPEALTDAELTLLINQAKSFNFQIDNIDKVQAKPDLFAEATRRAGYGLMKTTDTFCAGLYTDISATNVTGSDGSPITGTWSTTGTLAYDRLVDIGAQLDATDTPDAGRFVVVPPWFEAYLLKDARFVQSQAATVANDRLVQGTLSGQAPGAVNGYCGRAAGFDVYKSNQVPNTSSTKYKIIAGVPDAWAFADQIMETVPYTPEKRFGDALKGLHVYGAKVIRPQNLALLTANPT